MSSLGAFQKFITTPASPRLGPQGRDGTWSLDELNRALDEYFRHGKFERPAESLLRGAALLWHDHLDASHTLSQSIETRDGSWLHGIMHRREPDYGNAKYWFRRVARHAAFPELAQRVVVLLQGDSSGLTARLVENGEWMPLAFIDECEQAEQGSGASLVPILEQIQAAEMIVLIEHILSSSS